MDSLPSWKNIVSSSLWFWLVRLESLNIPFYFFHLFVFMYWSSRSTIIIHTDSDFLLYLFVSLNFLCLFVQCKGNSSELFHIVRCRFHIFLVSIVIFVRRCRRLFLWIQCDTSEIKEFNRCFGRIVSNQITESNPSELDDSWK